MMNWLRFALRGPTSTETGITPSCHDDFNLLMLFMRDALVYMPRGIQPVELFVIMALAAFAGQEAGHVVLSVGLGPRQGRVAGIVAGVDVGAVRQ